MRDLCASCGTLRAHPADTETRAVEAGRMVALPGQPSTAPFARSSSVPPTPAPADAIARHERYLAVDPANPLLLRALGDLYHQAGDFAKALETYEKCLALDPADSAAQSRIAGVCISQHRFADAESALRAIIARDGPDPVLFHNLGVSLYHQQRWADAAAALKQAREGGLREADNLRYLSYALHYLGDTAHALEVCDAWLKLAPSSATAGYRALLQMDDGDVAAAVHSAQQVVADEPDNPNANLVLGMWETERLEIEAAAPRFLRLTQAEPENPRAWLGLALVQLYGQQHEAAIASFHKALEFMPDNVGTIVALGWAQFAHNQIPAAEKTFRRAIEIERNFGESHGGLAVTLVWQNRREEARREIALAKRLDPKGFGLVYARSVLLALEGKRDQGERLLAQNLERSVRPDGRTLMDGIRVFLRRGPVRPPAMPARRLPVRR